MANKRRIHYTETDKAVMWDRWQKGESPHRWGRPIIMARKITWVAER
jgi:hypothetical protein